MFCRCKCYIYKVSNKHIFMIIFKTLTHSTFVKIFSFSQKKLELNKVFLYSICINFTKYDNAITS